ncbi:MAG: hypothetical protein AAFR54_19370, partial [Planctomycetota bacterium]
MLRNLAFATFAGLFAFWSYVWYDDRQEHERALLERDERIAALETDVALKDQEIARQKVANGLLRLDHRIAEIEVTEQRPAEDGSGATETVIVFTELDDAGEPMGPGEEMVVRGKRIYVDSQVVKFDDSFVEGGDALRGSSVAVFKRVFGEGMRPEDGIPIDSKSKHPLPFRGDELPDPMYTELFERIWDYANDPGSASELGVRAIQGEAPSV